MIDQDDIDDVIKDCEARESKLSEWEQGFVQSVRERFDRTGGIPPGTNEHLEKIWERIT